MNPLNYLAKWCSCCLKPPASTEVELEAKRVSNRVEALARKEIDREERKLTPLRTQIREKLAQHQREPSRIRMYNTIQQTLEGQGVLQYKPKEEAE